MAIWLALFILLLLLAALGWQLLRLQSALRIADAHQIGLQSQISSLQKDLHALSQRQPASAPRGQRRSDVAAAALTEPSSPYNQAIELARHGLSAAEVAERCGISRSEAELIVSLYRNSPTA